MIENAESRRDGGCDVDPALHRLATYGSLAPGRSNHHQLDGLEGRWLAGRVNGTLVAAGWGAGLGYPALTLDPDGPEISVEVFESVDLPAHWERLDAFEGPGYQRVHHRSHVHRRRRRVHLRLGAGRRLTQSHHPDLAHPAVPPAASRRANSRGR
jgi:gamma-glutamylcyclotransferase (GGCT)/AIG2-like uncharacterized protein YtfP